LEANRATVEANLVDDLRVSGDQIVMGIFLRVQISIVRVLVHLQQVHEDHEQALKDLRANFDFPGTVKSLAVIRKTFDSFSLQIIAFAKQQISPVSGDVFAYFCGVLNGRLVNEHKTPIAIARRRRIEVIDAGKLFNGIRHRHDLLEIFHGF
jgi:hypothetical protein